MVLEAWRLGPVDAGEAAASVHAAVVGEAAASVHAAVPSLGLSEKIHFQYFPKSLILLKSIAILGIIQTIP